MADGRPTLFGPDGAPANGSPDPRQMVTVPKVRLDEMVDQMNQLAQQCQALIQQQQIIQQDVRRYYFGQAISTHKEVCDKSAAERARLIDNAFAFAQHCWEREHAARVKEAQERMARAQAQQREAAPEAEGYANTPHEDRQPRLAEAGA